MLSAAVLIAIEIAVVVFVLLKPNFKPQIQVSFIVVMAAWISFPGSNNV